MLIDFTVANYRSIKELVTLSAVAMRRGSGRASKTRPYVKPDDEIAPPYEIEGRNFALLPVLGIFGPNASGKSNVIRALDDLLLYMINGTRLQGTDPRKFVPFKLDEASAGKPTSFRLRVAVQQTIYTYFLEVNQAQIFWERLEYCPPPPKQNRLLYDRRWDETTKSFVWKNGPNFVGAHTQLEERLQASEPFMSLLSKQLLVNVIAPIQLWFSFYPFVGLATRYEPANYLIAATRIHREPDHQKRLREILRHFDIGLSDIETKRIDPTGAQDRILYQVIARHDCNDVQIRWPFEEESDGTQQLLILADQMLIAFEDGSLMLKDELEASVHPQITRAIIRMFQNPETNPKRAQLIFTSHDHTLQGEQLLRRDQIWYTRKRPDHSTELYGLSEFKERNDRDIAKAYMEGRYGAIPILPPDEDLLPTEPVEEPVA
jgi:AAA15 family ATPase/GTPase